MKKKKKNNNNNNNPWLHERRGILAIWGNSISSAPPNRSKLASKK
jgi:hypothetical protein